MGARSVLGGDVRHRACDPLRLEDRIDERSQCRPLRDDKQRTNHHQYCDDRQEPPLLSHLHVCPELPDYAALCHLRILRIDVRCCCGRRTSAPATPRSLPSCGWCTSGSLPKMRISRPIGGSYPKERPSHMKMGVVTLERRCASAIHARCNGPICAGTRSAATMSKAPSAPAISPVVSLRRQENREGGEQQERNTDCHAEPASSAEVSRAGSAASNSGSPPKPAAPPCVANQPKD